MSTQPKDQEPSMEEILSSIRRIIADEETEESKPDDEVELASADAERVEFDALETLDDDEDDDADDVLELTSVVEEGAGVVDLNADTSDVVAVEAVESPIDEDDDDDDVELSRIHEVKAVDEDLPEVEVADDADMMDIELTPVQDDEPDLRPVSTTNALFSQEDQPAVSTKKAESETLLSTGTASTTTGAFAKLSKAFRPTPVEESVADGAGRTVEQFIEDMARPMLKEWLDENMPAIVERLVQKEIQKIARRAELL